jgi:MinD-like ATPase involved in chromosome partitioning or flagellar assembly
MSKIVSIHSFRGGTGKSNTTANVSVTVAQRGYRVGVIDTDINSPGIHVLFSLEEEDMDKALNDYLWGLCAIEETAYDVSQRLMTGADEMADISGSIYLVPSSIKAGEITRVLRDGYDPGMLSDGFHALIDSLDLDFLFIDTHPGLNEETLLSIAVSDALIIVMRPDKQDFQGTAVTVEVARKLDMPNMALLVNKALTSLDYPALRQQIETTYHCPVVGILPLSEDVARLASEGVFCLHYPDHPLSQTIQQVADWAIKVD